MWGCLSPVIQSTSSVSQSMMPSCRVSQATVLGLTALCNDCLGQTQIDGSGEELRYASRKDQLIHRYYPVWLENRNRANNA